MNNAGKRRTSALLLRAATPQGRSSGRQGRVSHHPAPASPPANFSEHSSPAAGSHCCQQAQLCGEAAQAAREKLEVELVPGAARLCLAPTSNSRVHTAAGDPPAHPVCVVLALSLLSPCWHSTGQMQAEDCPAAPSEVSAISSIPASCCPAGHSCTSLPEINFSFNFYPLSFIYLFIYLISGADSCTKAKQSSSHS